MKKELAKQLCTDYPKIFSAPWRNISDMGEDLIPFYFEVNDGWHPIIDQAANLIQGHINHSRKNTARALRHNRRVKQLLNKQNFFTNIFNRILHALGASKYEPEKLMPVPKYCPQVVALQVKEKFGTLRFYYSGGDEYITGIVNMAEAMSEVTCDICASAGKRQTYNGWLMVLCDQCIEKDKA